VQYLGDNDYNGANAGPLTQTVATNLTTCSATNRIYSVVNNNDGTYTLDFIGTPQAQYYVVTANNAAAALNTWTPIVGSTNTAANSSGFWSLTVTNNEARRFYRGEAINPCP